MRPRSQLDGVDQAVQIVVFAGVLEEVFLRPACEHRHGQWGRIGAVVGRQDGCLVAALGELTDLAHPERVAQARSALDELVLHALARGALDLMACCAGCALRGPGPAPAVCPTRQGRSSAATRSTSAARAMKASSRNTLTTHRARTLTGNFRIVTCARRINAY